MNEIEEIKARLDIVDVIGGYVQLQRAGRTYKAVCPFHTEKTPSFIVTPDRQTWHCFGACGTGGDVITFVMKREGIEFTDALKLLADRAGVKLPDRRASDREDQHRSRLISANEAAAAWYHSVLLNDATARTAREYIEHRGIDSATAESFLLGYSPGGREAARNHLKERGFTDKELLEAGLIVEGETGAHDRFRGRLMFPIRDAKGRVVGFGGRALDDSLPKYINTNQTSLFDKGGLLYALDRAQAGIRREGRAVLVEGYMDAISAHQHGFDNVVASMGTALTERQVRLVRRAARDIVLALDADAAGGEAAVRGHEVVRETLRGADVTPVVGWRGLVSYQETAAVNLYVAVLPSGRDPDDVIRADPNSWREVIESAVPVLDHRLNVISQGSELNTPAGRAALAQQFLPLLTVVTNPVVRANYLQRLSMLTRTREAELSLMMRGLSARRTTLRPEPPSAVAARPVDPREEFLVTLLMTYPELRGSLTETPINLVLDGGLRQLLDICMRVDVDWSRWEESEVVRQAVPQELWPLLQRLSQRPLPPFDSRDARQALDDCLAKLRRSQIQSEKRAAEALVSAQEVEFGPKAMIEATSEGAIDDERLAELVSAYTQDMQIGLKLHETERSDGAAAVETGVNG